MFHLCQQCCLPIFILATFLGVVSVLACVYQSIIIIIYTKCLLPREIASFFSRESHDMYIMYEAKSRETLRVEENKTRYFPREQTLSALLYS